LRERRGIFRYGGTIHDVIESGRFAPDMAFAEA
jgi:hypothetical protein